MIRPGLVRGPDDHGQLSIVHSVARLFAAALGVHPAIVILRARKPGMVHRNAPLTETGPLRPAQCVVDANGRCAARLNASRSRPPLRNAESVSAEHSVHGVEGLRPSR